MLTFKQFIAEAPRKKKVTEPAWHDADYQSGYSQLRDLQRIAQKGDDFGLQLFVPKKRDPKLMHDLKRRREWYELKRQYPDEPIKEETTPVLTAFKDSPVAGDNKPSNGFWTSTAIKLKDGYTSDWYTFVQRQFPQWQTDYGFLFEVQPGAVVLESDDLDRYYQWVEDRGRMSKEVPDYYKNSYWRDRMRSNFPWDEMPKHFDGVYHRGYRSGHDDFTYGWDVESTVWFNTKYLKYKGAVRLSHFEEDDE